MVNYRSPNDIIVRRHFFHEFGFRQYGGRVSSNNETAGGTIRRLRLGVGDGLVELQQTNVTKDSAERRRNKRQHKCSGQALKRPSCPV